MDLVWFLVGATVGATIAALVVWARFRLKTTPEEVELNTKLKIAEERIEELKREHLSGQQQLSHVFASLAGDALQKNNEAFLQLATQTLDSRLTKAQDDLEWRRRVIEGLVKPLGDALSSLEKSRQEAYGALKEQLEAVGKTQNLLAKETGNLVQALKSPHVRGKWGELTLRRVAELAGMVERCDFVEQQTLSTQDGKLRPDMVVYLPSNRKIVVDAKTPLDAYLEALEAQGEEQRQIALQRHARQVRERTKELSSKAYWSSLGYTPEFVILFLPGEVFLGAALQHDGALLEEGMKERVILATPSTLIALMHAVAYGWKQAQLAENARIVSDLGKELHDRLAIWASHLSDHRESLSKAVETFNKGVGSLESRVLVSARRFKELGIATDKQIPELPLIDVEPRSAAVVTERDSQSQLPSP